MFSVFKALCICSAQNVKNYILRIFFYSKGETFDGDPSRWMEFGLMELVCCAPDPYWFCFQNDYKWTCKVIKPLKWMKKNDFPNNIINNESSAAFQCKLNGKACLHLNQDLGEKMKALESKTVYIDVKVGSSLKANILSYLCFNFLPIMKYSLHWY